MLEHSDCSESLGAYALGALPEVENERVRRHVTSCRQCRAELEGLRAAVDALPASVPQIDPPPELKARLMEIVEAEADVLRAAGDAADRPAPPAPARPRRPRLSLVRSPAVALGLACLVAAAVVVIVLSTAGTGTRTIQAQVAAPLSADHVRASLRLAGTHGQLVVRGLPAPAPGHVDELWVKRGTANPRPAGTFVVQSGSVDVAGQVRRGDLVLVTVEPGRGTTAPTTSPVIVAHA